MSKIYVISYYEYSMSMSGRGFEKTKGYFESKFDADEYIKSKGDSDYGEYRCTEISPLKQQ